MAWTSQVRDFGKEAWVELTKVSWPSRNELIDSTVVVIGTVIIVTVFVYVADWLLRLGVGLLLH